MFCGTEVYNPWSICNFIDSCIRFPSSAPQTYWANTSSNDILRELVEEFGETERDTIQELIDGKAVSKKISDKATYGNVFSDSGNLWSMMLHTGYLKPSGESFDKSDLKLAIPNLEVREIFIDTIEKWFKEDIVARHQESLGLALHNDDEQALQDEINSCLFETISYYDKTYEAFYHGFMIALLQSIKGFSVRSNREQGLGRPDIIIYSKRKHALFELKAEKDKSLDEQLDEAARQITEKKYIEGAIADKAKTVVAYAAAFSGKSCAVRKVAAHHAWAN
jgi:hypothetical protein